MVILLRFPHLLVAPDYGGWLVGRYFILCSFGLITKGDDNKGGGSYKLLNAFILYMEEE